MLTENQILYQSLVINLYYIRTLRRYSLIINLSLVDDEYKKITNEFSQKCLKLGEEVINLANNNLPKEILDKGIFVTKYTLPSEELTNKLFNTNIDIELTKKEINITPGNSATKEEINKINKINNDSLNLAQNFNILLNEMKQKLNDNNLFSYLYPSFYTFIYEETTLFINDIKRIMEKEKISPVYIMGYDYYYSNNITKITKFMRSFIDPEQEDIYDQLTYYTNQFRKLTEEYLLNPSSPKNTENLRNKTLELLNTITPFLETTIQKVLNKTIYLNTPLITIDNVLTSVNFYKYILNIT